MTLPFELCIILLLMKLSVKINTKIKDFDLDFEHFLSSDLERNKLINVDQKTSEEI